MRLPWNTASASTAMSSSISGYRKYGHNEGDEPRFTQPLLYNAIPAIPTPGDLLQKLGEGQVAQHLLKQLEES